MDDGALAQRAVAGDRAAAAELVHRHQAVVRGFLLGLCGRPDLADDLAQETFLRLLRYADRYDPAYPMRTWLLTIARRLWINEGQRAFRKDAPWDETTSPSPAGAAHRPAQETNPAATVAQADERAHLRRSLARALAQLLEPQRTALLLFYRRGLSVAEIAHVMETPAGTVKSHLHRGRAALRELLTPPREMLP